MVVGDDAQSIYSWRGADFQNIIRFPQRYPSANVYKIETNYRSVPEILRVANSAISANIHQFPKELQSSRDNTELKPALVHVRDTSQQALFVAQRIQELRDNGMELNEIAIIYRAHYHSMEIQMELTRHEIPFQITSGIRFFEQAHIKDVAAFLKFVVNPSDELAFKRFVRLLPGIGARSAEQLWAQVALKISSSSDKGTDPGDARNVVPTGTVPIGNDLPVLLGTIFRRVEKVPTKAKSGWEQLAHIMDEIAPGGKPGSPSQMLASVIEAIYDEYLQETYANYEQRREDLKVLENYARQYTDAHEFLDQLALLSTLEMESEIEASENGEGKVTLSTVHQAKGLEWKVVFVVWMADGMFPSARSLELEASIEEERRLFYVAVTRARDELYLTWPQMRLNAGYGEMFQRRSRFLNELPIELLEEWQINAEF